MGGARQEALDSQTTTSLLLAVPLPTLAYLGLRHLIGTMWSGILTGRTFLSTCHGLGPYIYDII